MLETMYDVGGVGLAGPQVGISKQIFTFGGIDDREGYIINPVLEVGEEDQEGGEGCLSVPGQKSATPRKNWARVTGVDRHGEPLVLEGEGLFARMLQHETDHLDGKLYVNRLNKKWTSKMKKVVKKEGWTVDGNSWTPGVDPDPFGH